MEEARKIKVGISIGDPNGIGIEVILKIFEQKELFDFFTPSNRMKRQCCFTKNTIFKIIPIETFWMIRIYH